MAFDRKRAQKFLDSNQFIKNGFGKAYPISVSLWIVFNAVSPWEDRAVGNIVFIVLFMLWAVFGYTAYIWKLDMRKYSDDNWEQYRKRLKRCIVICLLGTELSLFAAVKSFGRL